jgi:hypothetical protein
VRLRADDLTDSSTRARSVELVRQALDTVPVTAAVRGQAGVTVPALIDAVKLAASTVGSA